MTVTIPDRFLPQIVRALENYAAYMNATLRDPRPFEEIIERLQSKTAKVAVMPSPAAAMSKTAPAATSRKLRRRP